MRNSIKIGNFLRTVLAMLFNALVTLRAILRLFGYSSIKWQIVLDKRRTLNLMRMAYIIH